MYVFEARELAECSADVDKYSDLMWNLVSILSTYSHFHVDQVNY